MKLHFYDDSTDGPSCGMKSNHSTDNGMDVTCVKCLKSVIKLHKEISVLIATEEREAVTFRGYEI